MLVRMPCVQAFFPDGQGFWQAPALPGFFPVPVGQPAWPGMHMVPMAAAFGPPAPMPLMPWLPAFYPHPPNAPFIELDGLEDEMWQEEELLTQPEDDRPRPDPAPAQQIAPRAPGIITPPFPEGLALLLEQRARNGAPAPMDALRGPAVVTPMPSVEELARLRRQVAEREAVAAPEPELLMVR